MTGRHPAVLAALLALIASGCSTPTGSDSVPGPAGPAAAFPELDSAFTRKLAPGVTHTRLWLQEGPWALHVVEIDTAVCTPQWSVRKGAGRLDSRATTSALAAGALAGINADFFQLPGGTPVGVQVTAGVPVIGPSDRAAWLWDGRAMYAGPAVLQGMLRAGADSAALTQVNRPAKTAGAYHPAAHGTILFTERAARVPPADSVADVVLLRLESGDERAGSARVLRVLAAHRDTLALEPGQAAVQAYGSARAWAARRSAGEPVTWSARVAPATGPAWEAREAVGGFPALVKGGSDVLAETPTAASFGPARHPRSAIGWSARSGRVFLVLVDGRQAPYSAGMSLPELTWVFQRLGATEALNLDGGGSSALVVQGAVANRPSDAGGERAVGNALVLERCR